MLSLFTQYNLLALIFRFTNQQFTHSYLHASPMKLLRETKRDFNFPYIYHKGGVGRRGQFEPLDADLTWSAFTSPAKPVAYWITRHLPLMRPNSRYWRYLECLIVRSSSQDTSPFRICLSVVCGIVVMIMAHAIRLIVVFSNTFLFWFLKEFVSIYFT